ncbi:MAG: hypothetical protein KatS3mg011_1595 [Acidimicrobiia bacterium]|nr:MAG: hypothetical protein KatS3mg011_1595 [Acidimicrobiia bacterium]
MRKMIALLTAVSLALVACGSGEGGSTPTTSGSGGSEGTAPPSAGGQIVISGSSTVEPITARVAEAFAASRPDVSISVDGPGTSDGFVLFCNGETDISDASRAIKESELETCLANGIEPIEIKVAIDGLSVITHPDNDMVSCLDFGDLYALLGIESTGFSRWSDANDLAAELQAEGLGARHAPYPDEPLVITAPGEESGTFDSFVELVLEPVAEARGTDPNPRPDYVASPNDNVIIEGISGNVTSLGWVGYAFVVENLDRVKALEVASLDGDCVAPTAETIASFEYPIARPLYIYVNKARAEEKPEVAEFVDFYLSDQGLQAVDETGYVRLTDEEYQTWRANWQSRNVGHVG